MDNTGEYITLTNLKKERGWTDWMIREFLGGPDHEGKGQFGRPAKLYSLVRIQKAEKSKQFKARLPEIWRLRIQADKAVKTKEQKTIKWAEKVDIQLKKVDIHYLYREVMLEHNVKDPNTVAEETTKRWMVNQLRHRYTTYDGLTTEGLYKKVGRYKAYSIIRERTLQLISKEYPVLKVAALLQIERKSQIKIY